MTATDKAKGRWQEILPALLGVDPDLLNGKQKPCPFSGCGGKDRFRFDDKNGLGTYFCNVCGAGNGFEFVKNFIGCEFPEAAQKVEAHLSGPNIRHKITRLPKEEMERDKKAAQFIETVLRGCEKLKGGDPVCGYLKERGLNGAPGTLLYSPDLYDTDTERKYDGMVAKIHAPNGEVIALHRTFLRNDKKAEIISPRKITKPITTIRGAAIRLWALEGSSMAITEGIETAMAVRAMFGNIPIWAVLSAEGIRQFQVPKGIKTLGIFADNDRNFVGQSAAYDLAARIISEGTLDKGNVTVYCPKLPGDDFLDEYNRRDYDSSSIEDRDSSID